MTPPSPTLDPIRQLDPIADGLEPVEYVALNPPDASIPFPEAYRGRVMIDTIHDGCMIPSRFVEDEEGRPFDPDRYMPNYVLERDWGANLVAEHVARTLALDGYYRVNIARVLMDYGRFPGITPRKAEHLHRYAINYPFSKLLSYQQKRALLEDCYDEISRRTDRFVRGKLVKVAIHTYDTFNSSGTVRPPTSIVTRSVTYQQTSEMPLGVFDPLYPDILAEFTADRLLRDRLSLTLEKNGIPTAHNYPYCLPEGSIEVRSQVWFFFDYVRRCFQTAHPDTIDDAAFRMVWDMLMDTNLRDSRSEALRSYLHMFRRPPADETTRYADARVAYEAVRRFIKRDRRQLVRDYRFSSERPSSLGLEVRKDLIWEFDAAGRPIRPKEDEAIEIARVIAQAILIYLNEDKPAQHTSDLISHERDPWYIHEHHNP